MKLKVMFSITTSLFIACGNAIFLPMAQADDYVTKSQIGAANGTAGLNGNMEVTNNIFNETTKTDHVLLKKPGDRLRFYIGNANLRNYQIDMFFNPAGSGAVDGFNKPLDDDTFYFTNNAYGNKYKFNGDVATTSNITVGNILSTSKFRVKLSTPSSSSEACTAGDIKEDINYHYVCVATNKWKRVALSDF